MNGTSPSNPLLNKGALAAAIDQCRAELRGIEDRLGTATERAGDLDRASEIVHRINNLTAALTALSE